jgi:hypothetical protein
MATQALPCKAHRIFAVARCNHPLPGVRMSTSTFHNDGRNRDQYADDPLPVLKPKFDTDSRNPCGPMAFKVARTDENDG